jgi:gas vesicle protein GvpO
MAKSANGSNGHVSAAEIARRARAQMGELTGQPVEGVLAVRRSDDGGWEVTVQVLELERIPNSTDVLGAYELSIGKDGEVAEYRRTRRYYRNQVEGD